MSPRHRILQRQDGLYNVLWDEDLVAGHLTLEEAESEVRRLLLEEPDEERATALVTYACAGKTWAQAVTVLQWALKAARSLRCFIRPVFIRPADQDTNDIIRMAQGDEVKS